MHNQGEKTEKTFKCHYESESTFTFISINGHKN